MEEENKKELPVGVNGSKLFTDTKPKPISIDFEGEKWEFQYRELSWLERTQIVDDSLNIGQGGQHVLDLTKYYEVSLLKMLVKGPQGFDINLTNIQRMEPEVGNQLCNLIVPSPFNQVDASTEKK